MACRLTKEQGGRDTKSVLLHGCEAVAQLAIQILSLLPPLCHLRRTILRILCLDNVRASGDDRITAGNNLSDLVVGRGNGGCADLTEPDNERLGSVVYHSRQDNLVVVLVDRHSHHDKADRDPGNDILAKLVRASSQLQKMAWMGWDGVSGIEWAVRAPPLPTVVLVPGPGPHRNIGVPTRPPWILG
jgi:hypothetical protein